MTNSTFEKLIRVLHIPASEGVTHPAEIILGIALQGFEGGQQDTQQWVSEILRDYPKLTANVMQCLGRLPLETVGEKGLQSAKEVLRKGDLREREATVSALENWGGVEAIHILQKHLEPTPWLGVHIQQVIKSLQTPSRTFEGKIKIVFVDIDGVLNTTAWLSRVVGSELCPEHMGHLNHLLEVTGAKVVISSSWRTNRTTQELRDLFLQNGFKGTIIGKTPFISQENGQRGVEIQSWLRTHYLPEQVSFVILDDEPDLFLVKDRLILTSMAEGLQNRHIEEAIQLLK